MSFWLGLAEGWQQAEKERMQEREFESAEAERAALQESRERDYQLRLQQFETSQETAALEHALLQQEYEQNQINLTASLLETGVDIYSSLKGKTLVGGSNATTGGGSSTGKKGSSLFADEASLQEYLEFRDVSPEYFASMQAEGLIDTTTLRMAALSYEEYREKNASVPESRLDTFEEWIEKGRTYIDDSEPTPEELQAVLKQLGQEATPEMMERLKVQIGRQTAAKNFFAPGSSHHVDQDFIAKATERADGSIGKGLKDNVDRLKAERTRLLEQGEDTTEVARQLALAEANLKDFDAKRYRGSLQDHADALLPQLANTTGALNAIYGGDYDAAIRHVTFDSVQDGHMETPINSFFVVGDEIHVSKGSLAVKPVSLEEAEPGDWIRITVNGQEKAHKVKDQNDLDRLVRLGGVVGTAATETTGSTADPDVDSWETIKGMRDGLETGSAQRKHLSNLMNDLGKNNPSVEEQKIFLELAEIGEMLDEAGIGIHPQEYVIWRNSLDFSRYGLDESASERDIMDVYLSQQQ